MPLIYEVPKTSSKFFPIFAVTSAVINLLIVGFYLLAAMPKDISEMIPVVLFVSMIIPICMPLATFGIIFGIIDLLHSSGWLKLRGILVVVAQLALVVVPYFYALINVFFAWRAHFG